MTVVSGDVEAGLAGRALAVIERDAAFLRSVEGIGLCDVRFLFGNEKDLLGHRFMLRMRVPFFQRTIPATSDGVFDIDVRKTINTAISREAFRQALEFIYSQQVEPSALKSCYQATLLLQVAQFLELVELVEIISKVLLNMLSSTTFGRCKFESPAVASAFLIRTDRLDDVLICFAGIDPCSTMGPFATQLLNACTRMIADEFCSIVDSDGLLTLSEESLITLLSCRSLAAPELMVFRALRRWVLHKGSSKKRNHQTMNDENQCEQIALPFLQFIQWDEIPGDALVKEVDPSGILSREALSRLYRSLAMSGGFSRTMFMRRSDPMAFQEVPDLVVSDERSIVSSNASMQDCVPILSRDAFSGGAHSFEFGILKTSTQMILGLYGIEDEEPRFVMCGYGDFPRIKGVMFHKLTDLKEKDTFVCELDTDAQRCAFYRVCEVDGLRSRELVTTFSGLPSSELRVYVETCGPGSIQLRNHRRQWIAATKQE